MKPFEWQQCVSRVRQVWGSTNAKAWDKAEIVYRSNATIQRLEKQSVMATIGSYETEGREWAPSIPQVLSRAAGTSETPERPDPATCPHPEDRVSKLGDVEVCSICLTEWESRDVPPGASVPHCDLCGDHRYVYADGRMYPCRRCEDESVGISP